MVAVSKGDNSPTYFSFPVDRDQKFLTKGNRNAEDHKQTFIFKRVPGTSDVYTIRSKEMQTRYFSTENPCQWSADFKDSVTYFGEFW